MISNKLVSATAGLTRLRWSALLTFLTNCQQAVAILKAELALCRCSCTS